MTRSTPAVLAVAAALVVSACGAPQPPRDSEQSKGQRYRATGTVLESPEHGPQLCHFVQESLPPQCSGADIVGWDWASVKAESKSGTTWGAYVVVGTWDGKRLTLTEPAKPAPPPSGEPQEPDEPVTPCEEPAGGWRPVDDSKATETASHRATKRARSAPESAGVWLDQSYMDAYDTDDAAIVERYANDPKRYVLNLSFTGDLAGREEWIREVWGGALCMSAGKHPLRKLRKIQNELGDGRGRVLGVGVNERTSQVEATVYVATDELQAELDDKYGTGTVKLDAMLKPVN